MTQDTLRDPVAQTAFEAKCMSFDRHSTSLEGARRRPLVYCETIRKSGFFAAFDPPEHWLAQVHNHGEDAVILGGGLNDLGERQCCAGISLDLFEDRRHQSQSKTGCLLYLRRGGADIAMDT